MLREDTPLRESEEGDEVNTLARSRTLTVLSRLDGERKAHVVLFLYESRLINKDRPDVDLRGADLSDVSLTGADLSGADLSGADLVNADLSVANLESATLADNKLRDANLESATMPDGQILKGGFAPHGPTFEEWRGDRRFSPLPGP